MCIIVDANVRDIVFGRSRTPASELLLRSIDNRSRRLVIGGKLRLELMQAATFRSWIVQARLAQQVRDIDDATVDSKSNRLIENRACKSDDEHVIALAQVSGARLLYTDDPALQDDFRDRNLINNPRGSVYSTRVHQEATRVHRNLLSGQNPCAWSDCGK